MGGASSLSSSLHTCTYPRKIQILQSFAFRGRQLSSTTLLQSQCHVAARTRSLVPYSTEACFLLGACPTTKFWFCWVVSTLHFSCRRRADGMLGIGLIVEVHPPRGLLGKDDNQSFRKSCRATSRRCASVREQKKREQGREQTRTTRKHCK